MATATDQPLMPASDAAKRLEVTLAELYRLVDRGELHAYRDDRSYLHVPVAEVEALATR
jgi:excisionase family DNA binding protein